MRKSPDVLPCSTEKIMGNDCVRRLLFEVQCEGTDSLSNACWAFHCSGVYKTTELKYPTCCEFKHPQNDVTIVLPV